MFSKARFMYEVSYIKAAAEHKETAYKQQQQDISKLDSILRKVGLIYDRDALNHLWQLSGRKIDNILSAVKLLLIDIVLKSKRYPIPNPG